MISPMNGKRSAGCSSVNRVSLENEEFTGVKKSLRVIAVGTEFVGEPRTVLGQDTVGTFNEIQNETLEKHLERLWKTDFGDSLMKLNVSPSFEDKRAHYQIGLL